MTPNQRGQASVFVLALIGVVLLSAIFLFESGRLTSEKMQLQNAADAAAFGASILEARSLNFAAYTNRAMVANEVAIGQMVGILSFVDELKTSGEYLEGYGLALNAIAVLLSPVGVGEELFPAAEALETLGLQITKTGKSIEDFLKPIASGAVKGLSIINTVYSASQTIYHGATLILEATTILQSLEDNVPGTTPANLKNIFDSNKKGAHLSDLGILALACHIPSYWGGHTTRYTTEKANKSGDEQEDKQVTYYKKKIKEDTDNIITEQGYLQDTLNSYGQAQIDFEQKKAECSQHEDQCNNNDSKDDCDQMQACNDQQEELEKEVDRLNKQMLLEQDKIQGYQDDLAADKAALDAINKDKGNTNTNDGLNDGMKRLAATVREARDPFTSGGDSINDRGWFGKQDYENRDWNLGLGVGIEKDFSFTIPIIKKKVHLGKFGVHFYTGLDSKGGSEVRYKGDSFTWSAVDTAEVLAKLELIAFSKSFEVTPHLPLGGGRFQAAGAGKQGGSQLTASDMPPALAAFGDPKAYGAAGDNRQLSWAGASAELAKNNLSNTYAGLQPYRDADKFYTPSKFPWSSPFFLVGVTRKLDDITKTSSNYRPEEAPHFSGGLNLYEDSDNAMVDRVGAIAKSEVYFDRPDDLRYFLRTDKNKEEPNVFSPFWQARLVKTSDIDRLIALAIQHKKIWLAKSDADAIQGLDKVIKELEKILTIF